MQVRLRERDDGAIEVTLANSAGGYAGGGSTIVREGEEWRGFRHRRLRRLARSRRELVDLVRKERKPLDVKGGK